MPLVQNFDASQSIGDISLLTLEDTSTGTDATITSRIVYVQKFNGDYLVQSGTTTDYEVWSYASSTVSLDLLDKDYALLITVKWLSGTTISYTKTLLFGFTGYSEQFLLNLTLYQISNNNLIRNKNFIQNKYKLKSLVDSASQAVSYGDQTSAQACLDMAKNLTDNQEYFF